MARRRTNDTPLPAEPTRGSSSSFSGSVSIPEFRSQQSRLASWPYDALIPTQDAFSNDTVPTADAIVQGSWRLAQFPAVDVRPPVAWDELCAADRGWHFQLHSWAPLGPVLAAYEQTDTREYLEFAVALAVDWARCYPSLDTSSPFAWYDMAVGTRSYRLGYLVDRAARRASVSDACVGALADLALLHAKCLEDDARFAAHSNHGFYFAAGQLALARRLSLLPGLNNAQDQAMARLEDLLRTQFTTEGVHREHSPEYHLMVFDALQGLIDAKLLDDERFTALSHRIQEALAWFVLPNGRLAMFGDTSHRSVRAHRGVSNDETLTDATGPAGTRSPEPMRGFPESGYAVVRCHSMAAGGGREAGSYLAQTCAFHSRVHKHADDLSFVWFDRGHELLIDPGKYGYVGRTDPASELAQDGFWYSDPNRIYVESTKAHNTVEVDHRSYPRRGVEPYGSALRRWGESEGIYFVESEATHWNHIHHERVLLFHPEEWLIVFDRLTDDLRKPHQFVQRFQFAPELAALASEDQLRFVVPGLDDHLCVAPLLPAEAIDLAGGERQPSLLGWISRTDGVLEPCWSAGFMATGTSHATFATLFAFGSHRIVTKDLPTATSKVDANGRKALLRWQHGPRIRTVRFSRPETGAFSVNYRDVASRV